MRRSTFCNQNCMAEQPIEEGNNGIECTGCVAVSFSATRFGSSFAPNNVLPMVVGFRYGWNRLKVV
jgi:hypothetical protein